MDIYELSPYIRLAWSCFSFAPFVIGKRIIFDYELIYLKQGKWELEVNNQIYKIERTYVNGQFMELYLTSSDIEVDYE